MVSLVLFKNNLRFNDNDVLYEACLNGSKILPVFIYDEINTNKTLGSSSKYWLHHSLISLNKKLDNNLHFYKADTLKIIDDLSNLYKVDNIFCEEPFLGQDIYLFEKLSVLCQEKILHCIQKLYLIMASISYLKK